MTSCISAQIMVIVAAAGVFSWLLGEWRARQDSRVLQGLIDSQWMAFCAECLPADRRLLHRPWLGDPGSDPLLVPICQAYGIDLIHFGIVMTMNLAIGMFTPPFGLNIFVTQALTGAPVSTIYPGLVPFIVITILALVVVTYVPWISLFLTRFV